MAFNSGINGCREQSACTLPGPSRQVHTQPDFWESYMAMWGFSLVLWRVNGAVFQTQPTQRMATCSNDQLLCFIQPPRTLVRDDSSIEPGSSPRRISQKAVLDLVRRIFKEMTGNHLKSRLILHPIGTVRRTSSCNMVLLLLSVIVAAILVAIPKIRNRTVFRGDLSSTGERSEQSRITGPVRPFLVVVLPDGRVVNSRVAERL